MDNEIQHQKAIKALAKAKALESLKIGYKFVKIAEQTKVYRKI